MARQKTSNVEWQPKTPQQSWLASHVLRPVHDQKHASVLSLSATFSNQKIDFLIDSGAERSVISRESVPSSLLYPCNIVLTGVGGAPVTTFGQCSAKLVVPGLRRQYLITVIAAKTRSIISDYFITEHGFQLDMKRRFLRDPLTNISASLTALTHPDIAVSYTHLTLPTIYSV